MKPTLAILSGLLALGILTFAARAQTPAKLPDPVLVPPSYVPGAAKDFGAVLPRRAADAATARPAPAPPDAPPAATLPPPAALTFPRPAPKASAPPTTIVSDTIRTIDPTGPIRSPAAKPAAVAGEIKDIGVVKSPPAPAAAAPAAALTAPTVLVEPIAPLPAPGGVVGGASFYYLKPYLSNNVAYRTTLLPGTPGSMVLDTPFNWNYGPAAAFWLGWGQPNGLGVRGRYFFFDQTSPTLNVSNTTSAAPQTTINPPLANFLPLSAGGTAFGSPGTVLNTGIGTDVLAFASTLQIKALDVEATYGWQSSRWSILASAGARYETLDQGYHARLANNGSGLPVSESQAFDATRSFGGGGPVVGLLGNVRVGETGFSLFGSLRGAVLVGSSQERVAFQQTVNDPTGLVPPGIPGTLQIAPTAARNSDRVLSVAEVELGVQYDVGLRRSSAFFRAGAVNHNYFDAGNASQATGNLSLFGVQFSAGLRY